MTDMPVCVRMTNCCLFRCGQAQYHWCITLGALQNSTGTVQVFVGLAEFPLHLQPADETLHTTRANLYRQPVWQENQMSHVHNRSTAC